MRATRNRVYGVTRIGGSNPSSSANTKRDTLVVSFFSIVVVSGFEAPRKGARG